MSDLLLSKIQSGLQKLTTRNIFVIFLFMGLCVYGNAIFHPFVHDDIVFIQQNPHIQNLDFFSIFFQATSPQEQIINLYYRPVLEGIYRLQYKLFGLNSHGFHLFNILIHIGNTFLVFCFCRFVFKEREFKQWLALSVAVIFLIHPVQSEAVACVSGISNTLLLFLCLISLNCYCYAFYRQDSFKKVILLLCSLLVFFLALFTKEQAVMFPVILVIYGLFFPKDAKDRSRVWMHGALFVLIAAGYFSLRKLIFGSTVKLGLTFDHEFWLRILSIPATLLEYVRIIFLPYDLHYYRSKDILDPYIIPLLILVLVLILISLQLKKMNSDQRKYVFFGLLWFIVWLLPVLNIVPIINEYSTVLTSDHFLYIPLVGILIAVFSVLEHIYRQRGFRAGFFMFSLIVIVFSFLTIWHNTFWKNEIVLFERVVEFEDDFGRGYNLLAKAYYQAGEYEKAVVADRKALDIMKGYLEKSKGTAAEGFYSGFIKGIHFDLAQYYQALGRIPLTLQNYREAIEIDPNDGIVYNNIATVYLSMGQIEQAFEYLRQSVILTPDNALAWNNLAICYIDRGELDKAEQCFRRALAYDPSLISAKDNLERLIHRP